MLSMHCLQFFVIRTIPKKCLPNTDSIQERIVHSAGHGKAVRAEEGKEIILPAVERVTNILKNIEQVYRKPACYETCIQSLSHR